MSGYPIPIQIPNHKKYINSGIISSSYDDDASIYITSKIPMHRKECKRVKILQCPEEKSNQSFEEIINEFILENANKFELIDIKYTDKSCLIIYKII
jgi:hypothetical protein